MFHDIWLEIKRAGKHLVLPPGFSEFITLESTSISIRSFVSQVVPGLLQTEGYARAVMGAGQVRDSLEELVSERMNRQGILDRHDPPRMAFVLDESVLHRPVGGPEVMREQLAHLIDRGTNRPNIQIRILPFGAATWAGLDGSFTILGFSDGPDIAHLDAPGSGQVLRKPRRVTDCAVRFDLVMGEALPSGESLKMIAEALEDYA